jgi:hypothetical protein
MPGRPFSQSQGKTASRDERSSRSHSAPGSQEHFTESTTISHCRVGGWPKRIEDRLVAGHAPTSPRNPSCGSIEHASNLLPVQRRLAACNQTGLDQSRSVQGPGRATDRGRQAVANGSQQLARTRFRRIRIQQVEDCLESDGHVVAMVAISEDSIQSRQVSAMALDCRHTSSEIRAHLRSADLQRRHRSAANERFSRAECQGGASVATLSSWSNGVQQFMCHLDDSLLAS